MNTQFTPGPGGVLIWILVCFFCFSVWSKAQGSEVFKATGGTGVQSAELLHSVLVEAVHKSNLPINREHGAFNPIWQNIAGIHRDIEGVDFFSAFWRQDRIGVDRVSLPFVSANAHFCDDLSDRQRIGGIVYSLKIKLNNVISSHWSHDLPGLYIYPLAHSSTLNIQSLPHLVGRLSCCYSLRPNSESRREPYQYERPIGPFNGCIPFWCFVAILVLQCGAFLVIKYYDGRFSFGLACCVGLSAVPVWFYGRISCEAQQDSANQYFHNGKSVTQKYLTSRYSCNTVIDMANVLSTDKQIAIIGALAEGSSIRSIERITGVHRDTIMRLGVKVGKGCEMLLDSKMQDLDCNYLQFDELWGFVGKKERHVRIDDNPEYGDVWTFCAIDSETKLVPTFKCGKRNLETTTEFVQDVASRMRHRVQVSSDAMHSYVEAMERAFGSDVDYGQCVKVYAHDAAQHPERKYSAPSFASAYRRPVAGTPEMEFISTSHVERLNATTRLHVKRLSRLTLAFSKKFDNFKAAVGLHFAYYNLVKRHNTLRCTPAMAAGVEKDFWTVGDLVEAAS